MKNLTFLFLVISCLFSQNGQPIVIGEQLNIYSETLKENRTLLIRTPANYTTNASDKYPVLYLLDGASNFQHTVATLEFLIGQDRVPEMLIVAITNTNRTRDLTPASSDDEMPTYPATGGADLFLDFIEHELVPYVDKNYRTEPFKLIVGHSFGGLFAVHSLFSRPKLFNAYIAISPSLWWNKRDLVSKVEFYLKHNQFLRGQFYMTLGNEGELMEQPITHLANVLKANAPRDFD
ncbi:MAG: alpha/beta hydrolase, partial [Calditrichaeota bacterium]|nr:alpha/beta hydrolase [Calditrichota bacterium]